MNYANYSHLASGLTKLLPMNEELVNHLYCYNKSHEEVANYWEFIGRFCFCWSV